MSLPQEPPAAVAERGTWGLALFIASLGVLYAGAIVACIAVGAGRERWIDVSDPAVLIGLALATLALLGSGVALHGALTGARAGESSSGVRRLGLAFWLGAAFLVIQVGNCLLVYASAPPTLGIRPRAFYFLLTALHGAHVLGGMLPLGLVYRRARRGCSLREGRQGILFAAMYWHFLDGLWLATLVILFVTGRDF